MNQPKITYEIAFYEKNADGTETTWNFVQSRYGGEWVSGGAVGDWERSELTEELIYEAFTSLGKWVSSVKTLSINMMVNRAAF